LGRVVAGRLSALGYKVTAAGRETLDVTSAFAQPADFDHVVHAAGLVGVAESWLRSADFMTVNVVGTVNALEYCRTNGCSMTMLSAYVYAASASGPISEQAPAQPSNPYALSKHLGEIACEFFARTYGMSITVLRLFNVYGPGQSGRFLIPTVLEQLLDPTVTEIAVDDLRPRRDYVYVSDVTSAVASTVGRSGFGIFNVGTGLSYSVAEVIEIAMRVSGIRKPYRERGVGRRSELPDAVADISALSRAAGWAPSVPLDAGLAATIEAMRKP
jgi:nucleoside-diphosphate-sugar epimerase